MVDEASSLVFTSSPEVVQGNGHLMRHILPARSLGVCLHWGDFGDETGSRG